MKEEEALFRAVRVVRGSWKLNGVSVVTLTAKVCTVCFFLFVPFALFAVHDSKGSARCDSNREIRENRESLSVCFSSFVPFVLFAVQDSIPECPL